MRGRCEVRAEELPAKSAPKTRNVKLATSAVWRYLGKKVARRGKGRTLDPRRSARRKRARPPRAREEWAVLGSNQ